MLSLLTLSNRIVNSSTPFMVACVEPCVATTFNFHTRRSFIDAVIGIANERAAAVNLCISRCDEGLGVPLYYMNYLCERHKLQPDTGITKLCMS